MATTRICSVDSCGKPHFTHGWCSMHYQRWKKHGDPLFERPRRAPICSVEGCERKTKGQGYCAAHYHRLTRHGSPLGGGTEYGAPLQFLHSALEFSGDECLIWPFARTEAGYPEIRIDGGTRYVHREVCTRVHGPAPSKDHESAHSCGKGHMGCINPSHLRWATRAENKEDELIHGTRNRGDRSGTAKLTEGDVLAIRQSTMSNKEAGTLFGVSETTIRDIRRRRTWAWL